MDLPPLQEEERALLADMLSHLHAQPDGGLPFHRYMELALYAPGLGYYVNGRRRFGAQGDFVTAPEVSPLFGQCVAAQLEQVLRGLGGGSVIEVGAGSGALAADMLAELERLQCLPGEYAILDLSPDLQALQRRTLEQRVPHLVERVRWLTALPAGGFRGVLVANELLDAMPVHRFRWRASGVVEEQWVSPAAEGLQATWRVTTDSALDAAVAALDPVRLGWADGFESELNLRLAPWLELAGACIDAGMVLLFDYGYPRAEYYLAERDRGTLVCHFRHRAYSDALLLPGLQDITANVDFTAVALAGQQAGFEVSGYTTQAHFLLDSGLDRLVAASDPDDVQSHIALVQGVKKLTLPSEMGERFQAIALTRDIDLPLLGFRSRDLRGRL